MSPVDLVQLRRLDEMKAFSGLPVFSIVTASAVLGRRVEIRDSHKFTATAADNNELLKF